MRKKRNYFRGATSLLLAGAMVMTSFNTTALAAEAPQAETSEPDGLKEKLRDSVNDEKHPGGVFGFYETILNAKEGEDVTIRVVRQGNTDKEASVVFKAVDVSMEYQKDYVICVDQGGLFGEKELPAADGIRPLMEEYGDVATEDDMQASKDVPAENLEEAGEETASDAAAASEEEAAEAAAAGEEEAAEAAAGENTEAEEETAEDAKQAAKEGVIYSGGSSLANIYSAQTGEAAPEYDWTEYNAKEAPEEAVASMQAGWDESKENLQSLPGVTCKLTFAPGEYKKDLKVTIREDGRSESDEVMMFVLQEEAGAEIGDAYSGYLNVTDIDQHEDTSYSVKEKEITVSPEQDTAVVTVVRNSGIDQIDFVTVGTQGIDAEADVDYVKTYKELFFAAGITERTVEVPIISNREFDSRFWVGIRSTTGTVMEDNACLVTIAAKPEENIVNDAVSEGVDKVTELHPSDAATGDTGAEAEELAKAGALTAEEDEEVTAEAKSKDWGWDDWDTCKKVTWLNKPSGTSNNYGRGKWEWITVPEARDINLVNADWIQVKWGLQGNHSNCIGDWRKKEFWCSLHTSADGVEICQHHDVFNPPKSDPNSWYTFTDTWALNPDWNLPHAAIKFILAPAEDYLKAEEIKANIRNITIGYDRYNFMIHEYNQALNYQEKIYEGKDKYRDGNLVDYPKVYFNDDGQNVERITRYSGDSVVTSLAELGIHQNSLGQRASIRNVDFLGFRVYNANNVRKRLSDEILPKNFTINADFKKKYNSYAYDQDGYTLELVPVFAPKKVKVSFCNDSATKDGKANVRGHFQGFNANDEQELTMLDTLDVRAVANQGFALTEINLQKKSGSEYTTVESNKSDEENTRLRTCMNFWVPELRVYAAYDNASIIVAPDPAFQDKSKLKERGSIHYIDHTITDGEHGNQDGQSWVKPGGETGKIDSVSINRAYTIGSATNVAPSGQRYHTFWADGTLDRNGDGVSNETHPSYKIFRTSIGNSIKYVTKLPISRIYYSFMETVDSEFKPTPIRGWLQLNDRLLISGAEVSSGLNDINVFCDGTESTTKYGGYGGKTGDGYFELKSEDYYKIYNYAVTFSASHPYGDIAAMAVMNPGINEVININAWEDVNITDVAMFQEVEYEENGQKKKKWDLIDTSGARGGYYTGLTDGDYNYRVQMTARRDGVNIDKGELTFYNTDGSTVVINGTEDSNHSGFFTFDFNPKTKGIKAGATARAYFHSGDTNFLSRDLGVKMRKSMGIINVINSLSGGTAEKPTIPIIGAVDSMVDMGWHGNFDQVTEGSAIGIDENGNRVIKLGINTPVADIKEKDKLQKAFKEAGTASKEAGEAATKVAKLEGKLAKTDSEEEKQKIQSQLDEANKSLKENREKAEKARGDLNGELNNLEKPEKREPKFGTRFTMDLGFSFLMTFGYSEEKNLYYFKNLVLSATLEADFNATVSYATPIGVTLGIGLHLGFKGNATFMIEQRDGEDKEEHRIYIDTIAKGENILNCDAKSPDRKIDRYGLFSIAPTIDLSLSAGVCGDMVKVSVSGSATFNMVFGTRSDSAGSCRLTASIGVKVLVLEFNFSLADKTFALWGDQSALDPNGLGAYYADNLMRALDGTDNSYLYESVDAFEPMDVSYMQTPSTWYGADGLLEKEIPNLGAIDEGGYKAYHEDLLADKIGPDPSYDMVSLGNGRFAAVFLNVPADRIADPNNSTAAYYTMFEGDAWSEPKLLEDDGTLDQYPRIYSMGDQGAVILWSSVNKEYKDSEDKIARQNALDLHGVIVNPDGSLWENGKIEEITMTTKDAAGEGTNRDYSDNAADKAFGVFLSGDRLVVCYDKRQYRAGSHPSNGKEEAVVGDMMYPVSSVMAARIYNLSTGEFEDNEKTLQNLPGLSALGEDMAVERVKAYNDNVYGQIFADYLPQVMLYEDIALTDEPDENKMPTQHPGYYRAGGNGTTAVRLDNPGTSMLVENDAAPLKLDGKDYGVMAYTLDVDGNLETLDDQELYLMTFDFTNNEFNEPIILTGYETNEKTGETVKHENSNPRFVSTKGGLYLTWLQNPDIVATNVSYLLRHEDELIKTGEKDGKSYRYVDKTFGSNYLPPTSLVTNRIAEIPEGGEEVITGNIHSFSAASNGDDIYLLWPEATDEENEPNENGMVGTQLWCARSQVISDDNGNFILGNQTSAVQVTSHGDNNYSDVAIDVTSDGKIMGLARQVPWRLISKEEARKIHKDTYDPSTFQPYPIWDSAKSYPVAFYVNPLPAARIKKADFVEADVTNGCSFNFQVLNDGFDTLTGAKVSAVDSKGNPLLLSKRNDITGDPEMVTTLEIDDLIGGGRCQVSGELPLEEDATEAKVIITLTKEDGTETQAEITKELKPDVVLNDLSVEPTSERNKYKVTGTVVNNGTAKAKAGKISLVSDTKQAANGLIKTVDYPDLMPGQRYEIKEYDAEGNVTGDEIIEVSLPDFEQKVSAVDLETNEVREITTQEELVELEKLIRLDPEKNGALYTEELQLYAAYVSNGKEVKEPVYAVADSVEGQPETEEGSFIKRTAYPSEVYDVLTLQNVTVSAITDETDEQGNVYGRIVSEGRERIILEEGETLGLQTRINTSQAQELTAVGASGEDVKVQSDGAEGLTYRYEFIGDVAKLNEDGQITAKKLGSGKLKVYVYPANRSYISRNGSAEEMSEDSGYIDTYAEYPDRAVDTYVLDVSVVKAGDRAEVEGQSFSDANGLQYRLLSDTEVAVSGIENGTKIEKLSIPATVKNPADNKSYNVTRIETSAFTGNQNLTSVVIGKNMTTIGDNAFKDCYRLTKVSFGNDVTAIGDLAFARCYALTGIDLPSKLEVIGDSAFEECESITKSVLPATLTSLGNRAFYGCVKLNNITIKSEKLTDDTIGKDVFVGTAPDANYKLSVSKEAKAQLTTLITSDREIFSDKKGIKYELKSVNDLTAVVVGLTDAAAANAKLKSLSIPAKVTYKGNSYAVVEIADKAFEGNQNLTRVTLPKSVTAIGDRAFADMTALKSADLKKEVTKLGSEAYRGDKALMKVNIASEIIEVGDRAFEGVPDTAVFNVRVKDAEKKKAITDRLIGDNTYFTDKNGIRYVIFTTGELLGEMKSAIEGQTGLSPEEEQKLLERKMAGVRGRTKQDKKVNIPANVSYRGVKFDVTAIGANAFYKDTDLETVSMGKNMTMIFPDAFAGCTNLKKVNAKSVYVIEYQAFKDCSAMTGITTGKNLIYIGENAFYGCTSLKNVPTVAE